jgi:uncharacterized protein YndB with AHSA1/START domain
VSAQRLEARIRIRGTAEAVWRELTKTDEPQAAVFNAWLHAQALVAGARLQMRTPDGRNVLVVGEVLAFDPPRRFSHTFRFTQYDDPPCVVTYEITPAGPDVEVALVVENLPAATRTAKDMAAGAGRILATLRQVVEAGRPAWRTRVLYALFARMGFVLPARTRAEHWPL